MTLQNGGVKSAKFHCDKPKSFVFKTRKDGADKATFDSIWLQEDEGAI
jgi:hypothetical protein